MAEMDINNDPSRQIRVKGLFRDLQFVLTRLPFAQARLSMLSSGAPSRLFVSSYLWCVLRRNPFLLIAVQADEAVHVMLQSLAKGCRRED